MGNSVVKRLAKSDDGNPAKSCRRPAFTLLGTMLLVPAFVISVSAQTSLWEPIAPSSYNTTFSILYKGGGKILAVTHGDSYGVIIRSTDDGGTWAVMTPDLDISGRPSLGLDAQGNILVGSNGGIYRSTDDGESWTKLSWTTTWGMNSTVNSTTGTPSGALFAATDSTVYRSRDQGNTWTPIGPHVLNIGPRGLISKKNGMIFVRSYSLSNALYCSTDEGDHWSNVGDGLPDGYVGCLALDAQENLLCGVSPGGIFRSTDEGSSWARIDSGMASQSIYSLASTALGRTFAATAWGLFRSGPGAWEQLVSAPFLEICINSAGDVLFGGAFVSGISRSQDEGLTWERVYSSLSECSVQAIMPCADGRVVMGSTGGLFYSSDNGNSWGVRNHGLGAFPNALGMDGNGFFLAGTSIGVFRSTNNGDSWQKILADTSSSYFRGLGLTPAGSLLWGNDTGIKRSTDNGTTWSRVYDKAGYTFLVTRQGSFLAGSDGGYVNRSTDDGLTWNRAKTDIYAYQVPALLQDSSGTILAGNYYGVFASTDDGASWILRSPVVPGASINSLIHVPGGPIVAGTSGGPRVSNDGGFTWSDSLLGYWLGNDGVTELAITAEGRLLEGTGSGFFRSREVVTGVNRSAIAFPRSPFLSQNYPNPFNPTTTIRFSLLHKSNVTLTVYNNLGQRIAILAQGVEEAGFHEVKFEGTGLSSGMYFYQLHAGDFRQTRMFLLLR